MSLARPNRSRAAILVATLLSVGVPPARGYDQPKEVDPHPSTAAPHDKSASDVSPADALKRLQEGNERFARHRENHPDQSAQQVTKLAAGQHPFAVVLSCSDSRVPPELVFDQGLGDLFVVRVAGNTIDDVVLGSIEYAVEHLGSRLVLVMGHEKCGAVQAALSGKSEPGHIASVARPIEPVIEEARKQPGDPIHNTVLLNARHVARQLRESEPVLRERITSGGVIVVSAVYDLESGRVRFDPPE
jgi:carbonic anhydrase